MKIAIAGYGIEGQSNYEYWNNNGNEVTIVDEKLSPGMPIPNGAKTILGEGSFDRLQDFDLVIRTAGLAPYKIKTNGKIWSSTNEFLDKCPAKIIGVTGTKGKGTTSSLIASIFNATGKKTWLVGNIGVAPLSVLADIKPDDVVVMEMSSFQLWDAVKSPHIAVILGIEPDHLDVHKDFDDYVMAKAHIRKFQKADDICIYHSTNESSNRAANVISEGKLIKYNTDQDKGVYYKNDNFYIGGELICSRDNLKLIGMHNVENACAAITVAKYCGVSNQEIVKGLESFVGLKHRLEFVRTFDGIDYYNDSFSSNPSASVAALLSFEKPIVLILGGRDKGADFNHLISLCQDRSNYLRAVMLIGESKTMLYELFKNNAISVNVIMSNTNDMEQIVTEAKSLARQGDVVLLSPACASFDMFKDFYQRGDLFRSTVLSL